MRAEIGIKMEQNRVLKMLNFDIESDGNRLNELIKEMEDYQSRK